MRTRRALLVEPGRFEIEEAHIFPSEGEMLVKIDACGLCNWELNHWKGIIGPCPQHLGHENSGTVVELGKNITGFKVGDIVTGFDGPGFADYAVAHTGECFKVNAGINPIHAFSEPLKCIVTVLGAANPQPGDVGVVVGCGPMGIWCIQALAGRYLGALIAVDIEDSKLELAQKYGATHIVNPKEQDTEAFISALTGGRMADFLIEGTGNPNTVRGLASYLKFGRPRLVIMSSYEGETDKIDFRPYAKRGTEIRFAMPRYSLNSKDEWRRAVDYINNGTFRMDGLISHVFPLDRIQEAFETLENKPKDFIKGVVVPEEVNV